MIQWEHMQAILREPFAFANVLPLCESGNLGEFDGKKWYIVLNPASGVLFDEECAEVWTVMPNGLSLGTNPLSKRVTSLNITSIDGRTTTLDAWFIQAACLAAWASDSYEHFLAETSGTPELGWGLLAYELRTGHSPAVFLRWPLPYPDTLQGIDLLAQQPRVMKRLLALKVIGPDVLKRQIHRGLRPEHPFVAAWLQQQHSTLFIGIAVVSAAAFVGVNLISLMYVINEMVEERAALLWIVIVSVVSVPAFIWSTLRDAKWRKKQKLTLVNRFTSRSDATVDDCQRLSLASKMNSHTDGNRRNDQP